MNIDNDELLTILRNNETLRARLAEAEREIRYLRHYGNKDCTHMADQAMERGDLDDDRADSADGVQS